MNLYPLFALIAFGYGAAVWFIIYKKPKSMMKIGKIEMFQNMIGEKATDIFYYVFGAVAVGLGVYFLTLA
ncbi:MAG: hypothetical protein Phog2KO_43280 [Phototrophicaceae bacterium]